ncbi:hypothetical protein BDV09DRAFT_189036 [Aspergillus tetrazonus]
MGNTSDSSSAGGYTGRRHADYWKLPCTRNGIDEFLSRDELPMRGLLQDSSRSPPGLWTAGDYLVL